MNSTEKKMLEILKELRDEHNVLAVKAEFEAEGSRTDELVKLNEIVFRADMKMFIKIGGCEAVRDLDQCRLLGASGIMAPMIETPFAMKKFVGAAKKVYGDEINDIEWIINAETVTCFENFDEILSVSKDFLNTVVIGRKDLSASIDYQNSNVNSKEVLEMTTKFAEKSKNSNLVVGMGGGISVDSISFIQKMEGLIDKFETRKIVFGYENNAEKIKKGILKAIEFESLYLQNKSDFYDRMANEDKARLKAISKRI